MRKTVMLLCALLLCAGCSDPAAQHQADQDRRQQTADDLRTLGERMHNQPADEPQQAGATDVHE